MGEDDSANLNRTRIHADYSAQVKVYDKPEKLLDKIAFTVTGDAGCEYGGGPASGPYDPTGASPEMGSNSTYNGGVNCHNAKNGRPKEAFIGWMMYNRYLVQEGFVCSDPGWRTDEQRATRDAT